MKWRRVNRMAEKWKVWSTRRGKQIGEGSKRTRGDCYVRGVACDWQNRGPGHVRNRGWLTN